MADPLWGTLQKALDNPQTINEAIDAAIAAHDADVAAHLGETGSLTAHKQEPVIDHPLGSVVFDKFPTNDIQYSTLFENLSTFTIIGDVSNPYWPGIFINAGGSSPSTSEIDVDVVALIPTTGYLNDTQIQFDFYLDTVFGDVAWWAGLGAQSAPVDGLGFISDGTQIKGYAVFGDFETHYTESFGDISDPIRHVLRVQYSTTENIIRYFYDGVQVATLTPSGGVFSGSALSLGASNSDTGDGFIFRVFSFQISCFPSYSS